MPLHEHVKTCEEPIEDADHLGRGSRCASGVNPTTSAKRMEAAAKSSAIVRAAALSRSAIGRGRMFTRRASDFSCSARSALNAALRWWAKVARSVKAMLAVPMTFNASIVLVNHTGRSASGKNSSPATPVARKMTMKAPNQRTA